MSAGGRVIVLGMGNTIKGDDAVGIIAARRLKSERLNYDKVDIKENEYGSVQLLDLLQGYDKAIIIDSISLRIPAKRCVLRIDKKQLSDRERYSSHQLGICALLKLSRKLSLPLPQDITILAAQVTASDSFSTLISPEADKAADELVEEVKKELGTLCTKTGRKNKEARHG